MDYITMTADCVDEHGHEFTKVVFITESDNYVVPEKEKIADFDLVCALRTHWRTGPVKIDYIDKTEWMTQREEALKQKEKKGEKSSNERPETRMNRCG